MKFSSRNDLIDWIIITISGVLSWILMSAYLGYYWQLLTSRLS